MECVIATQVQKPSEGHVLNIRDKRDELPLFSGPIPELRLVHIFQGQSEIKIMTLPYIIIWRFL